MTLNTTLNKAIATVLTHQYKKDAKEAHAIVENAGYGITKNNGHFEVYNRKTDKRIYVVENRLGRFFIAFNPHKRKVNFTEKFDFVNCLETPLNKEYWDMVYNRSYGYTEGQMKREALKSARWSVKYEMECLMKIDAEIEKLKKDRERRLEWLAKAKENLATKKKELGLDWA